MDGLKKDASLKRPEEDFKGLVTHHYEGGVLSPEYNVNNPEEYPYHALYPHGKGKLTYTYGDEVVSLMRESLKWDNIMGGEG